MSAFQQTRWDSLGKGLGSGVGTMSQNLQNEVSLELRAQGAERGDLVWVKPQ